MQVSAPYEEPQLLGAFISRTKIPFQIQRRTLALTAATLPPAHLLNQVRTTKRILAQTF